MEKKNAYFDAVMTTRNKKISRPAAQLHRQDRCINCGSSVEAHAAFCSHCGQKTTVHRLSYHSIAHDFVHYFTHVERNVFSLIKNLSFRPGVVCREYLQGKRKKYFPPVNFFLVSAGLMVLSVSLFNTFQAAFAAVARPHLQNQLDFSFDHTGDRLAVWLVFP